MARFANRMIAPCRSLRCIFRLTYPTDMLRLLFLLLLLSGPLCGQTLPDSSRTSGIPPVYAPPQRTAADTVRALHRLFSNRRTGGALLIALGGITLFVTPLAFAAADDPSAKKHGSLGAFVGGAQVGFVLATPIVALGIYKVSRSSKAKEEQIIYYYTEKHVLPQKIKRKLRPELFLPLNSSSYPH